MTRTPHQHLTPCRLRGIGLLCLGLLAAPLLLPSPAHAQQAEPPAPAATATIATLSHVDKAGRWRTVDQSDQGSVLSGETEDILRTGAVLQPGDRILTRQARVELRLSDGSRVNVAEDSRLVLAVPGDQGAWQRLAQEAGTVYYRLRNALTVEHGTVEAVVEGTRFLVLVQPGEEVAVKVEEGVVRVARDGAEGVRVSRKHQVLSSADLPAPPLERWSPSPAELAPTWPLGRPRLVLGVVATGQILAGLDGSAAGSRGTDGGGGLRLSAGWHLPADLRLELDAAPTATASGSLRVPVGIGLGWDPGPVSLGGSLALAFEDRTLLCEGQQQLLHLGGTGWVRYDHALGRTLALRSELRAGYLGDLVIEPAIGLGVRL